jgi:EAL domain-containing protein (putative c-di-GMP-specific phosphodiesterase class I)/CheY-like chemotaxis protein
MMKPVASMLRQPELSIMVVDDEPFMLNLIARILVNQGFSQVTTCDNGHAALELFDSPNLAPDLILLDLNMPEMDGIEFIRHLVQRGYMGSLILVSGEGVRILQSAEKLVRAHQITVLGHLRKPVKPEELDTLIKKWLPASVDKLQTAKTTYSTDEVRSAINNAELKNYYQPKVAVSSGEVVGVETLVRWHHPEDGLVFPDQFIHVAEANNLIDDLTRMVFAGALAQARLWKESGLALSIAVNVSMDNLVSLEFADVIAAQAADAGIAPQDLVLEVTESGLIKNIKSVLDILTRLRLKRFHLSIDDFGTGHSSLIQLSDIPFDELKVDRSFVHGAWNNETTRAIYDASLSLAKQLGMEVVAEGVEDREDWDFLCKTGCDLAQGYFIGKPMPGTEIPRWIDTWNARLREF